MTACSTPSHTAYGPSASRRHTRRMVDPVASYTYCRIRPTRALFGRLSHSRGHTHSSYADPRTSIDQPREPYAYDYAYLYAYCHSAVTHTENVSERTHTCYSHAQPAYEYVHVGILVLYVVFMGWYSILRRIPVYAFAKSYPYTYVIRSWAHMHWRLPDHS